MSWSRRIPEMENLTDADRADRLRRFIAHSWDLMNNQDGPVSLLNPT